MKIIMKHDGEGWESICDICGSKNWQIEQVEDGIVVAACVRCRYTRRVNCDKILFCEFNRGRE